MTRVIKHVRSNVIAYLALFVALGGTSYAAVSIPNHSVTPSKLDSKLLGGYVRGWVSVRASGQVLASSGGVRVQVNPTNPAGYYVLDWHPRPTTSCTAVGNVAVVSGVEPGYLVAGTENTKSRGEQTVVQTYGMTGEPTHLPFNAALICGTPK